MTYIYAFKCPWTDRVVYIGKTANPKNRLIQHYNIGYTKISRYLNAVSSLGKPATFCILETVEGCGLSLESKLIRIFSLLGDATHNVHGNTKMDKTLKFIPNKVDNSPVIISQKIDIIREIKYKFYHDDCAHNFSLHALQQILKYVNNPI